MVEKEMKVLLDKDEYDRLDNLLIWDEVVNQTNYYYSDSNGIISEKKITVRIREINGSYKLEIKAPVSEDNSLHISREYEEEINSVQDILTSPTLNSILKKDKVELRLLGNLKTMRKKHYWNSDTEICLDKNEYQGITDYELEIEYTNELDPTLLNKLKELSIQTDKKVQGKYLRFLNSLKQKA